VRLLLQTQRLRNLFWAPYRSGPAVLSRYRAGIFGIVRGCAIRSPTARSRRCDDQWSLDDSHRNVVIPGTPVLILGVYRYGASPPWVSLESIALPLVLPETLDATSRNVAARR